MTRTATVWWTGRQRRTGWLKVHPPNNAGQQMAEFDGSGRQDGTATPGRVGAEPAFHTKNNAFNKNFV